MPLPRVLARFNKYVTNRVQLRWAHVLPGYGVLEHTGRKSGRTFRTPLNVFAAPDGFVIPMAYGPNSDWVRNLLAAGGGRLQHRRRFYVLSAPEVLSSEAGRAVLPRPVRVFVRVVHADVIRVHAQPA